MATNIQWRPPVAASELSTTGHIIPGPGHASDVGSIHAAKTMECRNRMSDHHKGWYRGIEPDRTLATLDYRRPATSSQRSSRGERVARTACDRLAVGEMVGARYSMDPLRLPSVPGQRNYFQRVTAAGSLIVFGPLCGHHNIRAVSRSAPNLNSDETLVSKKAQ
ncbi:hypothetical protein DFH06DRAFT_1309998 [Mycena polygramma]|nr:hypothetical protein DFH06DRAFT_1309998 [Mycena polygramma]